MVEGAASGGPNAGRFTRRAMARNLIGVAVAAVTAQAALHWWSSRPARHPPADDIGDGAFDEIYEGRHIRGSRATAEHQHAGAAWDITVDGRPLHLMRRADGGYLSMIDHYQSYPTPLIATRRAVDELGPGRQLRRSGA